MAPLTRFRRVVIVTTTVATGGPEAIHQLAYSLNCLGVDAKLAYLGEANPVQIAPDRILCATPTHPATMEIYRDYRPQVAPEIPLDPQTLVILPEVFAAQHAMLQNCGVAIWWLSIDNAIAFNPALGEPAGRAELFKRDDLIHLYQSVYAREWLRYNGARNLYDLSDYTSALFHSPQVAAPAPVAAASFNLQKGATLAEEFFAAHPRFNGLGLRGFSKAELRDIFAERLLYVDFGHFPGKDRMPREAAACGSIVFVRRQGAGAFYDDFPIADFFKFTPEDIASGELARRLDAVVADPQRHWAEQAHYRSLIAWEKASFHDQVMRLWGVRRMI